MASDMIAGISITTDGLPTEVDNLSFVTEIQDMMYGFGDSAQPLVESAQLIEEIVHQQMVSVCYRAMEVAEMRGSKSIKVEDLIFLIRNNKMKLQRILKYLALKEIKRTMNSTINEESVTESTLESRSNFGKNNSLVNFLLSIDQTGEIEDILFSAGFETAWTGRAGDRDGLSIKDGLSSPLFSPIVYFDSIKHDRSLRADEMATAMDKFTYLRFTEARRACFASPRNGGSARFWEWIANPKGKARNWKQKKKEVVAETVAAEDEDANGKINCPQPTAMALEVLSLMAFECVAQIVDMALMVRRDALQSQEERLMPPLYFNPNYPVYDDVTNSDKTNAKPRPHPRKNILDAVPRNSADAMVRYPQPLTLAEIQEAIRRYWAPSSSGPLSYFARDSAPNPTKRFLCS
ncbi:hypothetical protein J437_LFUL004817 [Ladona fulva]|uniref:Uncharacterized protein n=1 Tax=Ladona fulva TaxID=123851 RepID=A0A8K0K2S8_LADFU|nr:hypothetical protein J437_LFUL004817 [Ladona fulva]